MVVTVHPFGVVTLLRRDGDAWWARTVRGDRLVRVRPAGGEWVPA